MVTSKLGRKRIKHATYKYIQCCFHALKRYIRKDFPLQMEVFSYHIAEKTYNSGKKICVRFILRGQCDSIAAVVKQFHQAHGKER